MKGDDVRKQVLEVQRKIKIQLQILPTRAKVALVVALFLSVTTYAYIIHYFFFYNHVADFNFLETRKCPACFGHALCKDMRDEGIAKLEGYSKLQIINSLANVKNINYGTYGGKKVVYKKLAHNSELDDFDKDLCEKAKMGSSCKHGDAIHKLVKASRVVPPEEVRGISDMTKCPTQRLIDRMIDRYQEKADAIDMSYPEKLTLMTTLMVNPEPILIQTFPKHEGFPFPQYIGACGRFIVVENAGKTLGEYYNAPWPERLDYATQLFRIAELFTENSSQFALYWTDLSYENFVINTDGKVVVVDAENILVVDRWKIKYDEEKGWDEPFYSEFDDCERYGTCLSIHADRLCSRYTVDFNYYAVCRNLLSSYGSDFMKPGGLLHDTPADVNDKYQLDDMLRQCAKPDKKGGRLEIKDKLLKTLEEVRRNVL